MSTYSGDKLYFNDPFGFDSGKNWDVDSSTIVAAEMGIVVPDRAIAHEVLTISIDANIDIDESSVSYVDLLQLVPQKFQSSPLLVDFLQESGIQVGSWLGYIKDLTYMLDPYNVGEDYIQYLADLIGLQFLGTNLTLAEKRLQLLQAIDLYKMKGTYNVYDFISYKTGLSLQFHDLYTNNYSTFIEVPWYANYEGLNPSGLDSSYYKSPHFGTDILLDKFYITALGSLYLFKAAQLEQLQAAVEVVRPINTVPHYNISLQPETVELNEGYLILPNQVKTAITSGWVRSRQYFDSDNSRFDDGTHFDQIDSSLINSVTEWRIGTGNKNQAPISPEFALENVVLTGSSITIEDLGEKVNFSFTVTGHTIQGISELGLYTNLGEPVIFSTFPDIDITSDVTLKIIVSVYVGGTADWTLLSGDRLGREYELTIEERMLRFWDNLYNSKYNRLCLTAKTTNRWDTWEMDWDTAETGNYELDYPHDVGTYYWEDSWSLPQGLDTGRVYKDAIFLYSQIAKQAPSTQAWLLISTSEDGVNFTPYEVFIPTIRTLRYFKMYGYIYVDNPYMEYLYYSNVFNIRQIS